MSLMAPAEPQSNETRLFCWAMRLFQHITADRSLLFQEYLPSHWRIRLPSTGFDIDLAHSREELIHSAQIWYGILRNIERWDELNG
jgi:hypothetical protein